MKIAILNIPACRYFQRSPAGFNSMPDQPEKNSTLTFSARLEKIGINPFVFLPKAILENILKAAGKEKGNIAVKGIINHQTAYRQTLLRYKGEWRLYINTNMLKNSPERIGEKLIITIEPDYEEKVIPMHPKLMNALKNNPEANRVFNLLRPSLQKEMIRYISFLKTEESIEKNINKAMKYLSGKGSFVGRQAPEFRKALKTSKTRK